MVVTPLQEFLKAIGITNQQLKVEAETEPFQNWQHTITNPFTVSIPIRNQLRWEFLHHDSTQTKSRTRATNADKNWVSFYRQLPAQPLVSRAGDQGLNYIVGVGSEQGGNSTANDLEILMHEQLKAQGYTNATPKATCPEDWLQAIRNGVDVMMIVTHGDTVQGLLVQQSTNVSNEHIIPFAALEAAIIEGGHKRQLRFLCVFACDTARPLLELLERLAAQSCLHPHFGALVAWDKPDTSESKDFLQAFFKRNFETNEPDETIFLDAIRQGRRSLHGGANLRVIAVLCNVNAKPLPTLVQAEMEKYMCDVQKKLLSDEITSV
jgi:hypothetical protein